MHCLVENPSGEIIRNRNNEIGMQYSNPSVFIMHKPDSQTEIILMVPACETKNSKHFQFVLGNPRARAEAIYECNSNLVTLT